MRKKGSRLKRRWGESKGVGSKLKRRGKAAKTRGGGRGRMRRVKSRRVERGEDEVDG